MRIFLEIQILNRLIIRGGELEMENRDTSVKTTSTQFTEVSDDQLNAMSDDDKQQYLTKYSNHLNDVWRDINPSDHYCGCCGKRAERVSDSGVYCSKC